MTENIYSPNEVSSMLASRGQLIERARLHWSLLLKELKRKDAADQWFTKLVGLYMQPHRHYHTLTHIMNMLGELPFCEGERERYTIVALATWFHDSVYNPRSESNEVDSGQLFWKFKEDLRIKEKMALSVMTCILATQHNKEPKDENAQLIVDMDLAILGKPRRTFREYERNIRQEYYFVPEEIFRKARQKILHSFIERKFIFYTRSFRGKYERIARSNIQSSLKLLS